MVENVEKCAEFPPRAQELLTASHRSGEARRCSRCQVRKVLTMGFYRDRKSRGGYRRECKLCRKLARRERSRRRRSESRRA